MQPDDPKLTAYVLDELSPSQRDEVESQLSHDPRLADEAQHLRRTADQLQQAFAALHAPALPADARHAILAADARHAILAASAAPRAARPSHTSKPLLPRLRRTFRWAACFAVLIGATYLLGLAFWKDTRPGISLLSSSNTKVLADSPASNRAGAYETRLGLAAPLSSSVAVAESTSQPGHVTYTAIDSVTYPDIAAAQPAEAGQTAGGFWMLTRDGDVTVKQYISPEQRAALAAGTKISGARFYGFTPGSPVASRQDNGSTRLDFRHEFGSAPQVSYAYQVPFNSRGVSGDGRPEQATTAFSLNQDQLTPSSAGDAFTAPLTFTQLSGHEVGTYVDSQANDEIFSVPLLFSETYGYELEAYGELPYDPYVTTQESYAPVTDNPFVLASAEPVSTFSIDVDTASYSNIRRHLLAGQLPPKDAVRIEEMINAFHYDYPEPAADRPFSVSADVGECPWTPAHRLVRVGLQGYRVDPKDRPPLNLVFLIDVSGSMQAADKLPLVQESLKVLLEQLWAEDRVGIVTYAGESAIALPSTPGARYDEILTAIDALSSGGSTNGEAGIRDAYRMAKDNFIEGGVNRVMLCTDGDFNVGVSDDNELVELIRSNATSGVFLTVLGFGTGNLKDGKLEALADKGNGHYAYIDDLTEAKRVLGDEAGATLQTIAKDVKIQVQFNPALVQSYRLIGYENRMLAAQDFADDTKDAGEIGAGHSVTALYEVVPASAEGELSADDADRADELDARKPSAAAEPQERATEPEQAIQADAEGNEAPRTAGDEDPRTENAADSIAPMPADALLLLKLRYKAPDGAVSQLIETPVLDDGAYMEQMPRDFLFAASVASFGMLLRESPHVGDWTFEAAEELARSGVGDDPSGYRAEFVQLVRRAIEIRAAQPAP
ncbi:MAG: von Willebrand factor type A domain-containing protein [Phycisphaerales bacterium]|nr:von Willebrand factor type A domain-containing protein [Phycisphaerales bacterium]